MFIGHFGLSFAAKKAAPEVSLLSLFVATQFADILWPFLLLFGVEKMVVVPHYTKTNSFEFLYYPWTHSLLMGAIWGILLGALYGMWKNDRRGAVIVGLCVWSHWFFDLPVHVADLPLTPFGDVKVGFGLWNHVFLTLAIELILFFGGAYIYATSTKARKKAGNWGLGILIVLLSLIQVANTFSPPPSGSQTSMLVTLLGLMGIILLIAWWTDKNRQPCL